MKSLWIWCFIASFVSSFTVAKSWRLKKQLFGFRMCQHFCQQVSGCHVLTYRRKNLTCHISNEYCPTRVSENTVTIFNVSKTNSLKETKNGRCHFGNIFIWSRAGSFHCVQYVRRQRYKAQKDSARRINECLKMTSDTKEICENLYQLCDSGNRRKAKDQLFKLYEKSEHAGQRSFHLMKFFVVNHRCDLSQVNHEKNTILHEASKAGLLHVVKCVLSKSVDSLESLNSNGMTAIMESVREAQTNTFRLLLNVGSDLSKIDQTGNSLLHLACQGGSLTIVQDIFQHGSVNIHRKTRRGLTPIMTAVQFGKEGIFKLLLAKGSSLSDVSKSGCNLLHIASKQRNLKLLKNIFDRKIADIDSEDNTGRTPLMMTALGGQEEAFHFLLEHNANLSVIDAHGNNLLHAASKGGDAEIVKYLVKLMGKDAKMKKNKAGKTPLDMTNDHRIRKHILEQMQNDEAEAELCVGLGTC